jgi:hypothetical protein
MSKRRKFCLEKKIQRLVFSIETKKRRFDMQLTHNEEKKNMKKMRRPVIRYLEKKKKKDYV